MNERGQYGSSRISGDADPFEAPLPASQRSWFLEHPWMTFFLAFGAINGAVQILSGSKPPPAVRFNFDAGKNAHSRKPR